VTLLALARRKNRLKMRPPKIRKIPMEVERVRHLDCSEPDKFGMHEYYYEWDDYWFTDGALFLLARSHTDEPEEADFMGINLDGESREIALTDLSHPLFIAAYAYLLTEGKVKFNRFTGKGYKVMDTLSPNES
jgi:hypothetical protein